MGWELLRPGGHQEAGAGRFRRHGAGGTGALQHRGGDQEVRGGVEEDCGRLFLPIGVTHRNAGRDKDDLIEWI